MQGNAGMTEFFKYLLKIVQLFSKELKHHDANKLRSSEYSDKNLILNIEIKVWPRVYLHNKISTLNILFKSLVEHIKRSSHHGSSN